LDNLYHLFFCSNEKFKLARGDKMISKRLCKEDLENIVRGACLLSSGGGGTYSSGMNLLKAFTKGQYYDQDYVDYVDVDDLPDSSTDCGLVVAYMGAPKAIAKLKYPEAGINAAKKVKELMEIKGQKLAYIVPVEIGSLSSIVACTVAAKLSIPVINGDGAGRAVPELMMTAFAGHDISTNPTILATEKNLIIRLDVDRPENNNSAVIAEASPEDDNNSTIVEAVARPTISLPMFGQKAGLAMWVMPASKIKEVVKITNTLVACKEVGKLIAKYQEGIEININDLLSRIKTSLNTEAYELCSGTLCSAENVTEGGFDHGKVVINGEGGRIFTIVLQNENLLAWDSTSGTSLAMAPDAIAYVVHNKQVVYSNGDMIGQKNAMIKELKGKSVSVIGIAAHPELRKHEEKKRKIRDNKLQSNGKDEGEIIRSFELALEKLGYYGAYVPLGELQEFHHNKNLSTPYLAPKMK
jgi:uncharacterized protein